MFERNTLYLYYYEYMPRNIPNEFCTQSVSPGVVRTEFADASDFTGDLLDFLKEIPFLQSKDIADAVIYVLGTPPHVQVGKLYSMYKLRCTVNQPTPHLVSPS